MNGEVLKRESIRVFVKDPESCDLTLPHVKAAIITAAARMAKYSEIVTESDVLDALVKSYKVEDDSKAGFFIGMGYPFAESLIGFKINYDDPEAALAGYQAEKTDFDSFYRQVLAYKKIKAAQETGKLM